MELWKHDFQPISVRIFLGLFPKYDYCITLNSISYVPGFGVGARVGTKKEKKNLCSGISIAGFQCHAIQNRSK